MNDRDIIFLLEDNSLLLEQLKEALEKNEYIKTQANVFPCLSIELANTAYDEFKDRIACLACDSNMSSVGLPDNLRSESKGGLFSGWLWMREKIIADESLADRSLVYSAYFDELQKVMHQNPLFSKVPCVRKKTISTWDNEEIIKVIISILKVQKGR